MFKYYLLFLIRGIKRNRSSFLINLIGLSTGLACALLIYLWVKDELQVDKFNEHDERIFQILQNSHSHGVIQTSEVTPGILAEALKAEIPEVEYAASVVHASWFLEKGVIKVDDTKMKLDAQYVGKDYFKIFTIPLIVGNKTQSLNDKYSVLISENLAQKLFGSTSNVTGKTVRWNQDRINGAFKVAGIFKNLPYNSSEKFDLIFNYDLILDSYPWLNEWGNADPSTFVLLNRETKISTFNTKIKNFLQTKSANSKKHCMPKISQIGIYITNTKTVFRMAEELNMCVCFPLLPFLFL